MLSDYFTWAKTRVEESAFNIIKEELSDPADKSLEKALILSANIAGMTCNRAAAYNFTGTWEMFDVAIIDEVCKATLPEILTPLIVSKKAVLLGDPKQLPPVFCTEERDIIRQIDNCNLDQYMYIDQLFEKSDSALLLDTQYRMTNQIGEMISSLFYGGKLKNGRNKDSAKSLLWITYTPTQLWPTKEEEFSERPRIFNEDEGGIIARLITEIQSSTPETSIGIITPYKAQAASLRTKIGQSGNIKIDTVDGFQGKECDVVIFSVTRTRGPFRFLADNRRLNVALSRAKDRIIIVGDAEYAKKNELLSDIMKYCTVLYVERR